MNSIREETQKIIQRWTFNLENIVKETNKNSSLTTTTFDRYDCEKQVLDELETYINKVREETLTGKFYDKITIKSELDIPTEILYRIRDRAVVEFAEWYFNEIKKMYFTDIGRLTNHYLQSIKEQDNTL